MLLYCSGRDRLRAVQYMALHAIGTCRQSARLQANIYAADRTFTSFKQMVRQLDSSAMLVSLHSTSKGFVGECGRRGGYMEVVNFPPGEQRGWGLRLGLPVAGQPALHQQGLCWGQRGAYMEVVYFPAGEISSMEVCNAYSADLLASCDSCFGWLTPPISQPS